MVMNRRAFFASLFAPFVARFIPRPALKLDLEDFRRRYIDPYIQHVLIPWANKWDREIAGSFTHEWFHRNAFALSYEKIGDPIGQSNDHDKGMESGL